MAGWPAGRMAGWPGGRGQWSGVSSVAGWPGGWVAGWPGGWPGVCHPLAYQAACLFVHFGEFSHTHQC